MSAHRVHPWLFMVLILPFGVMSGYLTVAVAYLLTKSGVPVAQIAGLIAVGFLPHTWKFLWAPIADTTLTRKGWYVIGCVASAIGIWATGAFPLFGLIAFGVILSIWRGNRSTPAAGVALS